MLECLKNIIGLKRGGCGNSTPPPARYYLEDAEFFNESRLADIADLETNETGRSLFESKLNLASEYLQKELLERLNTAGYAFNASLYSAQLGTFSIRLIATPAPVLRGLAVERICSKNRLAKLQIKAVRLLCYDDAPNASLILRDGALEYQYPVSLSAGIEKVVYLYYTAQTDQVYLLMNNAGKRMDQSALNGTCCGSSGIENYFVRATGYDDGKNSAYSWGIVPEISVQCQTDFLLCEWRDQLAMPLWLRLQEEILLEAMSSGRINSATMDDAGMTIQLNKVRKRYMEQLDAVINASQTMLQTLDKHCIFCEQARLVERAL